MTIKAYADIADAITARTDLKPHEKDMIRTAEERAQKSWELACAAVRLRLETYDELKAAHTTIDRLRKELKARS
jgi:tetraacyldisaccharide-1-P 4'-kinase